MNNKTRLISGSLAALMILLSACTASSATSSTSKETATEKPVELVLAMPVPGSIPKDLQAMQDELNKITLKKLNVKVKITLINVGSYSQQLNLILASNENLDLMLAGKNYNFSGQATNGQLLPLNQLMDQYGQELKKAHNSEYLKASTINGKLYAIPVIQNYVIQNAITMQKDLVDKYNIDMNKIKSLDDLDPVFKAIKEHEPNITPIVPRTAGTSILPSWYDELGDGLGVLPGYDNNLKVVDVYETPEYARLIKKMRSWYTAGYMNQDVTTTKDSARDLISAGKAFSAMTLQAPGSEALNSRIMGKQMVVATLDSAYINTANIAANMWAIPRNSKNPEKAMSFLNLMFSDQDVVNLLDWGVEGKHYVKVSDNQVDFPTGQDKSNSGFFPNWAYLIGNQFLSYLSKGDAPDLWKKMAEFNNQATKSKVLGFNFDQSPVKTEIVATTNVVGQYKVAFECGAVDPDTVLPEFIKKLKAAGIDKIITEKQKQLDEWAKSNK
jgi:putative aldouronate transport system substrate-binding protein